MENSSKKYHESNNMQVVETTRLFESVKDILLQKNFNNLKMIDIGTGDGRVLVEVFLELSGIKFLKVIGSDRRKDVIEFAQETYGSDLISFEVLDIEHASEEDIENVKRNGEFDLGTSFFCLQYAIDHEKTFTKISKLLKPGGSFYFNFLGHHSLVDIFYKLVEKYPQLKVAIYDNLPLLAKDPNYENEIPKILDKCGFEIDFLKFDSHVFDFKTEESYMDCVTSSIPFFYETDVSILQDIRNDLLTMAKTFSDNPWAVTFIFAHGLITKRQ